MFITKWNAALLMGIGEIDQCNRYIVQSLTDAYGNFIVGINVEVSAIDEILSRLTRHFSYEERMMAEVGYPFYLDHKQEHEVMTRRLSHMCGCYEHDANTSVELMILLNNWVNHHIKHSDAKLGSFIDTQKLKKRSSENMNCSA